MRTSQVFHGNNLDILANFPPNSIDAVVTDPPYALGTREPTQDDLIAYLQGSSINHGGDFMGHDWELPSIALWKEVHRVLKPGAPCLTFGGTRTFDLIALGLRAAGLHRKDTLQYAGWLFGTGLPKSKTLPKPAWEPILLARKPGPPTPLQIDACRVGSKEIEAPIPPGRFPPNVLLCHNPGCIRQGHKDIRPSNGSGIAHEPSIRQYGIAYNAGLKARNQAFTHLSSEGTETVENWLCTPDCPIAQLDQQTQHLHGSGFATPGSKTPTRTPHDNRTTNLPFSDTGRMHRFGDTGTASRFYPQFAFDPEFDSWPFAYFPKASRSERNAGCTNPHPTVKPIALMRWLCKLVTPPQCTLLDPFAGSGSTLLAAQLENYHAIGIEKERDYIDIIHHRLNVLPT